MNSDIITSLKNSLDILKLKISNSEVADYMIEKEFSDLQMQAVADVFAEFAERKEDASVNFLLKCSRLPMKNPKTFENFDFSELSGKGLEKLKSITTLAPLYAHRNLAFIGPAGTGKTHLAMAFGYECCKRMMKTYFVKMTELNDMFTEARKYGRENRVIDSLVKPSCLVIDEVGYCNFDTENTRLFFDMIDCRYNKEGNFNIIFTSNKQPKFWKRCFAEEDTLKCAMDRIFDDVIIFNFSGSSHRGQNREAFNLTTRKVQTVSDSIQEIE